MDLDTFLTALYTVVDDLYQESLAHLLRRPGPAPKLSDAEVLTLSIYAEWGPWDSERGFWRFAHQHLRRLFPHLIDQSEFNRRRRALSPALAQIQRILTHRLGAALQRERLIDTKPVAVMVLKRHDHRGLVYDGQAAVGRCGAKQEYYYGFKLVLTITLEGLIVRYELVPASTHDLEAAAEVLERDCRYWADKGFASHRHQDEWLEFDGAQVIAEPHKSHRTRWSGAYAYLVHRLRQIIEVVNAQLEDQFAIERTRAKTLWGVVTRVQAKLTAHTFGVYLNVLLGRPTLQLKDLVV